MHASHRVLASCGGPLAAGLLVLTGVALSSSSFNITAWMHNLLAYSAKHPVPTDTESDYGVVLGYALHKNGSCTRPLQSRVEVGVAAYQRGEVAALVFSGAHPGAGPRHVSEANAMARYAASLVAQPPPPGRWLLEELSTSTRTNAVYSLQLIAQQQQQQQRHEDQGQHEQEQKLELQPAQRALQQQHEEQKKRLTLVLVTNPFHQWRSFFTFRRAAQQAGMDVQLFVAAAPFAGHCGYGSWMLDAAADQADFWRELAAIAWYSLRGWL